MKMILNFRNHGCVEPARAHTHENPVAVEPGSLVKFACAGRSPRLSTGNQYISSIWTGLVQVTNHG
jgi:hypothetical protein